MFYLIAPKFVCRVNTPKGNNLNNECMVWNFITLANFDLSDTLFLIALKTNIFITN